MPNFKTISEVYKAFKADTLIVDSSYQRRSVWDIKDKVRLIETILMSFVIPELFFWKASTNPDTGDAITHIVDGQQRVTTFMEFIEGKFKLTSKYLLDDEMKSLYANKYFSQLDPEIKNKIWQYRLTIVEIDTSVTREDIAIMFRRLNLTNYSLNDQERRNSMSGEFSATCKELAEEAFWEDYSLFKASDVRRMLDVEFCGSLLLLWKNGIIDQTDQTALNQAYEDYKANYNEATTDKQAIRDAIEIIKQFFCDDSRRFIQRKTQLYTLFCVAFQMIRDSMPMEEKYTVRLNQFIMLYELFENDMELSTSLSPEENQLFDMLKKYKLASSEGLNKHTNRMIRYNVLKTYLFSLTDKQEEAIDTLREHLLAYRSNNS